MKLFVLSILVMTAVTAHAQEATTVLACEQGNRDAGKYSHLLVVQDAEGKFSFSMSTCQLMQNGVCADEDSASYERVGDDLQWNGVNFTQEPISIVKWKNFMFYRDASNSDVNVAFVRNRECKETTPRN